MSWITTVSQIQWYTIELNLQEYISNERKWKTALKEMHAEESIHFLFTIQFAANNDCRFQISCDTQFKQLITEEIM